MQTNNEISNISQLSKDVADHQSAPRPGFIKLLVRDLVLVLVVIVPIYLVSYAQYWYLRLNNPQILVPNNLESVYSWSDRLLGVDWGEITLPSGKKVSEKNPSLLDDYGPAPEFENIVEWYERDPSTIPNYVNGTVPSHFSNPVSLKDLKGTKPILVSFGRLACSYCLNEYTYLNDLDFKYGNSIEIVSFQSPKYEEEQDWEKIVSELDERTVIFKVGLDIDQVTSEKYRVDIVPSIFLINKDGTIVFKNSGLGNYDKVEEAILELIYK